MPDCLRLVMAVLISAVLCLPVMATARESFSDDLIVRDPVMIPTRDGASIYAIVVHRKNGPQRLPATLFFTPYYQGQSDLEFAKIPAERGYVGVVAYSRGIRTDIGKFIPYVHDGDDASDVIRWIARQPWSNGQVGMFGGSYLGFVQWSVLRNPPAALKTVVPSVAVMPGFDFPMQNNVSQAYALSWANGILNYPTLPANLQDRWYTEGLAFSALDSLAGWRNRIFQQWLKHPAYDRYWRGLVPTAAEYQAIHIPILVTDGYYDADELGSIQYIRQYLKYNPHPDLYLLIGPYDHFGAQRIPANTLKGYTIDPVARLDIRQLTFAWLDYVLKDAPRPTILANHINYEVMGANKWRHVPTLAAMHDAKLRFYLSNQPQGAGYRLDPQVPAQRGFVTQSVNFRDRTTQNNYFSPFIMLDKLDPSHGIEFISQPFKKPVTISGSFSGKLRLAINKHDLDFSLALYELMPDGKYFFLNYYLGRASYAQNRRQRDCLHPNVITTIPLAAAPLTSRLMVEGSRLVVILNVNKNAYDEINYGRCTPVADQSIRDAGTPLKVRWYNSSFITIPVNDLRSSGSSH